MDGKCGMLRHSRQYEVGPPLPPLTAASVRPVLGRLYPYEYEHLTSTRDHEICTWPHALAINFCAEPRCMGEQE